MSKEFRELLKIIGSGTHTHKNLSRTQAYQALEMMLTGMATPAQIGGFLIAHRIKRPTGAELAGMLDVYHQLGAMLPIIDEYSEVVVLGIPYDGRSRTAPISPMVALILTAVGIPVIMHGGDKMPTKYGLHLAKIWQFLGIDVTRLSLDQVIDSFKSSKFGFLYLPLHFPLAHQLVKYREEIGKRPPLATLELIWQPYEGKTHLMAGYVHPPTENIIRECLNLVGRNKFTLIKGLEGSPDLKLSHTNIIAIEHQQSSLGFQYLKLNARDYGYVSHDPILENEEDYLRQLKSAIAGKLTDLTVSSIWNGGFYLWRCGVTSSLEQGLEMAESLIFQGELAKQLNLIKSSLT